MPSQDSRIYKKYRIINKVGSGGFSDVFKVETINEPHQVYALKYLKFNDNTDNTVVINRFKQEIALYKSINSIRIAKYIESYVGDDEQYLVMEFVEGESLHSQIRKGGKLISKTAVNYAMQIAEALGELHSIGIIHRDIKSNNIMITRDRNVKVIDFGLALGQNSQRFTQDLKVIGSVYYLAPELCTANNKPSIQTDIYALGILLYEMLTGTYPLKGSDALETMKKQKSLSIPDITKIIEIPQALANVIYKATNKDPSKRYKTMWEMREDLSTSTKPERYYEKPYNAKRDRAKKSLQEVINSKQFIYSAIAIILVVLIVGIVLIVVFV
ncbi:serine/threonine-protein kinase [Mycoplasmopsis mucosicanis]|nr:serine/threonine-protein kinase [Mycoplasmopsis mucosicanis]